MSVILPVAQRGEDILRLKAARVADAELVVFQKVC